MHALISLTDRIIAGLKYCVRIFHQVENYLLRKQIQWLAWNKRRELGKRHQAIRQRASP